MGAKHHRIDHHHLLRHSGIHPHHDEDIEHLVDAEQDARLRERITLALEVDLQHLRQHPRHGEQHGRATEGDQILQIDRHIGEMDTTYHRPDENRRQDEVQAFLLPAGTVFNQFVEFHIE